jgi:two-component system, NtrC family, response regulator HydG
MTGFTTVDPAFAEVLKVADRAALVASSVLVLGETGTGKNRLARYLHEHSPRASAPFVEIACANVPPELFEAEIFGYERGAFTDAKDTRPGRLEQAHLGTLFLDEIQEFEVPAQAKLLRALEERRFERLGGRATIEVDVRVIASTREAPATLVAAGRLRPDLLYRLDVVRLEIPPLRRRVGDVPALAAAFLEEVVVSHRLPERRFADRTLDRLSAYSWPGNVRELRHAIERAAVLARGPVVEPEDLPDVLSVAAEPLLREAVARAATLADVERAYIEEVLRRTRGNKSAAARILGIHRKTLHDKLRSYGEHA